MTDRSTGGGGGGRRPAAGRGLPASRRARPFLQSLNWACFSRARDRSVSIPSILEVNCDPHCCLRRASTERSASSLEAPDPKSRRRPSFFL